MYCNEIDSYAADYIRNLWQEAKVDERSIVDVAGADVAAFRRCHFFAGIGGWEYALSLAGWPEDREVWTGSCPCQPFSAAGKGKGTDDARHLWPEFRRIIAECRPATIFGEQVASKLGREWLAGVRADLEALGYAFGAADLCAAGVGAPHIRQRLFWVAGRLDDPAIARRAGDGERGPLGSPRDQTRVRQSERSGSSVVLAYPELQRAGGRGSAIEGQPGSGRDRSAIDRESGDQSVGMGHAGVARLEGYPRNGDDRDQPGRIDTGTDRSTAETGGTCFWGAFDLVACRDGKTRRVEPGTFPLAHGVPNRVGKLRAYGNAIVPQVAAVFIRSFLEAIAGQ